MFSGILQPIADGIKLFIKENSYRLNMNKILFIIFPSLSFLLILIFWIIYLFFEINIIYYRIIVFIVVSGVGVYGVIGAGWASNSNYRLLGAYRGVAQIISYEVRMVFIIMCLVIFVKNYNLYKFSDIKIYSVYIIIGIWFFFLIWFVVILAELNRAPFDFAEGESELVSGFNVEYGGGKFALIFLAEYGNIIFISYIIILLFVSGYIQIFIIFIIFILILVRRCYPRYRYDNLIYLTWINFLPFILMLILILFYIIVIYI